MTTDQLSFEKPLFLQSYVNMFYCNLNVSNQIFIFPRITYILFCLKFQFINIIQYLCINL